MRNCEDLALSPDNRRLGVAGFVVNKVFLFSLEIDRSERVPRVRLAGCLILNSPTTSKPHGLTFLDDEHLLVCNRWGDACIFRVPAHADGTREIDVAPLATIPGKGVLFARVKNPGSAGSCRVGEDRSRVLICNNYWNFISSHDIQLGRSPGIQDRGILSSDRLQIPDGISVSPDGAWFAVSNHARGEVLLYGDATGDLGTNREPAAALGGMVCPHGLRFLSDDTLVIADAACPYLHIYRRDGAAWTGERSKPSQSVRVLDDERYFDGRFAAGEGGVKGLDVDRTGALLITTTRLDPLGFWDLRELLEHPEELPQDRYAELSQQRQTSMRSHHAVTLTHRWTPRQRVEQELRERRDYVRYLGHRVLGRARTLRLDAGNRLSSARMLDARGPVVSLTTHSGRIDRAHYAIESIARGTLKPSRIVLWLTEDAAFARLPAALRRLEARGVEIRPAEELGPHSKYFPYLESTDAFDGPLVTADDDAFYPSDWLRDLMEAHSAGPQQIHCHRARRMGLDSRGLLPYNEWPVAGDDRPSPFNFILGVGGVIYPPAFLACLKRAGRAFLECCPTADDIWLTVNAIRAGFEVRQLRKEALQPEVVPGTQGSARFHVNFQGANQEQLRRTFTPDDLALLRARTGSGPDLMGG